MYAYYDKNEIGTDYVCGDIHGCFSDLEDELNKLNFDKTKDRLFCVGDLTDRGPESEKALEYITQPWFYTVYGNHEDMIIRVYKDRVAQKLWHYQNGGRWVQYFPKNKLWEYIRHIENLPVVIQIEEYAICHSMLLDGDFKATVAVLTGMNVDHIPPETYKEYIIWNRDENRDVQMNGIKKIYAGHTIHSDIKQYGMLEDIDTGAFLKYFKGETGFLTIKKLGE